jgi:hypothetical protein
MSSPLEPLVVLVGVRSNFGEPLVICVAYLVILHQVPNHGCSLNRGKAHFNEEDRIGCIAFNFDIISYNLLFCIYSIFLQNAYVF